MNEEEEGVNEGKGEGVARDALGESVDSGEGEKVVEGEGESVLPPESVAETVTDLVREGAPLVLGLEEVLEVRDGLTEPEGKAVPEASPPPGVPEELPEAPAEGTIEGVGGEEEEGDSLGKEDKVGEGVGEVVER